MNTTTAVGVFVSDNLTTSSITPLSSPVEAWKVWLLSTAFVTAINLCSLLGVCFNFLSKFSFYKSLLIFMVALAVGVLSGSSVLVLIPAALDIDFVAMEHDQKNLLFGRITMIMFGIILFFNTEVILKMITAKKAKNENVHEIPFSSMSHHQPHEHVTGLSFRSTTDKRNAGEEMGGGDAPATDDALCGCGNPIKQRIPCQCPEDDMAAALIEATKIETVNNDQNDQQDAIPIPRRGSLRNSLRSLLVTKRKVSPVAYMVIFGDGIHNFIDGLGIGAAFASSIPVGVSMSIAVFAEELPHEFGDFAILIKAGLSVKRALCLNFLSACLCYAGMILGILLGSMDAFAKMIYALAGGMFLYISLSDMLPELNHSEEIHDHFGSYEENAKLSPGARRKRSTPSFSSSRNATHQEETISVRRLLLQNVGVLIGYGLMLVLAMYAEKLDVTPYLGDSF